MIFGLMAERRVHLELGKRSGRSVAAWQRVFYRYFHPINGSGRSWSLWSNPSDGLRKFRKSVMTALQFHFDAFNEGMNAPTQVQIVANDLMIERNVAIAAEEVAVVQQAQHQGRLLAANRDMSLVIPGQGVQAPPNLGFDLTRNQELVLTEIAQRTHSVDTRKYIFVLSINFSKVRCHLHYSRPQVSFL